MAGFKIAGIFYRRNVESAELSTMVDNWKWISRGLCEIKACEFMTMQKTIRKALRWPLQEGILLNYMSKWPITSLNRIPSLVRVLRSVPGRLFVHWFLHITLNALNSTAHYIPERPNLCSRVGRDKVFAFFCNNKENLSSTKLSSAVS